MFQFAKLTRWDIVEYFIQMWYKATSKFVLSTTDFFPEMMYILNRAYFYFDQQINVEVTLNGISKHAAMTFYNILYV